MIYVGLTLRTGMDPQGPESVKSSPLYLNSNVENLIGSKGFNQNK